MPISRILILTGSVAAFLLMLTSVTASQEFVYAPESAWRESSDDGEEVAVAVWRAQQSAVAQIQKPASDDSSSSETAASTSSVATTSSAPAQTSSASAATSSAPAQTSSLPVLSDDEWWNINPWGDRDDEDRRKKKKGRDGDDD